MAQRSIAHDNYTCGICTDAFSETALPLVLVPCGDTICARCVRAASSSLSASGGDDNDDLRCPICQQPFVQTCPNRFLISVILPGHSEGRRGRPAAATAGSSLPHDNSRLSSQQPCSSPSSTSFPVSRRGHPTAAASNDAAGSVLGQAVMESPPRGETTTPRGASTYTYTASSTDCAPPQTALSERTQRQHDHRGRAIEVQLSGLNEWVLMANDEDVSTILYGIDNNREKVWLGPSGAREEVNLTNRTIRNNRNDIVQTFRVVEGRSSQQRQPAPQQQQNARPKGVVGSFASSSGMKNRHHHVDVDPNVAAHSTGDVAHSVKPAASYSSPSNESPEKEAPRGVSGASEGSSGNRNFQALLPGGQQPIACHQATSRGGSRNSVVLGGAAQPSIQAVQSGQLQPAVAKTGGRPLSPFLRSSSARPKQAIVPASARGVVVFDQKAKQWVPADPTLEREVLANRRAKNVVVRVGNRDCSVNCYECHFSLDGAAANRTPMRFLLEDEWKYPACNVLFFSPAPSNSWTSLSSASTKMVLEAFANRTPNVELEVNNLAFLCDIAARTITSKEDVFPIWIVPKS